MDKLWLHGIECRCRIGVPAKERRRRQKILVDVGFELDLRRAAKSDELRHALDYQALEGALRARAEGGEFRLLERLAGELLALARRFAPRARAITLRARKSPAAMPRTREVVVELAG